MWLPLSAGTLSVGTCGGHQVVQVGFLNEFSFLRHGEHTHADIDVNEHDI